MALALGKSSPKGPCGLKITPQQTKKKLSKHIVVIKKSHIENLAYLKQKKLEEMESRTRQRPHHQDRSFPGAESLA